MLLGYSRDFGKKKTDVGVGNSENTFVSLFITIEPPLGVAPELKEMVSSSSYLCLYVYYLKLNHTACLMKKEIQNMCR